MPDNQKIQSNAPTISSNGPIDEIQEEMCKMKVEKKEEEEEQVKEQSAEYPDRPGEPDCIYYLKSGKCGYGSNCRFNHPPNLLPKTAHESQDGSELPQRENEPDCGYYIKTGTCKYGSSCKFHHPLDRRGAGQVVMNSLGLPIRKDEKPCPYYMRTYTCKFGSACKFDHPEPTPLETTISIPGPAAMGTMGSTLPSTGFPYVGTLPAWLPKSSLVPSSRVPGSQTYMPFVLPPLQSPLNAQSWNSYMGNLSSISASDMMGPNFVYNSTSQGELATVGSVDLLTQAISSLPQRPDQPECRYFMSTGSCKYGSNCKFHHPKERIALNLGPHGLPFRPGQDMCGYFTSYGVCKYGATCKYDHPMSAANYYYGMPPIPVDLPVFPSTRNIVISNSTEASQSEPAKITEWIQKPETCSDKSKQNNVPTYVQVLHEEVHDDNSDAAAAAAAAAPTSELPQDPSD